MARKSRLEKEPEPKLDLTPMIDIIFNLIIFFMIVSDFSALTVEDLQLAYADEAQKADKGSADKVEKVLQINVMEQDGLSKVKGIGYTGLIPVLVEAVKEQQKLIEAQAARIEALERRIE